MRYKAMGTTGVKVSQLCMGTMTFGQQADRAASQALFTRCLDAGINMFDCADVYAGGESEVILGELVKGRRDELVIATKAYFPTGAGPNARGASRYHLVRACEASLRRLDTDHIDVFYVHRFDDLTDLEDVCRGLELLVQQGKILYPAVSNYAAWQVMKALGIQRFRGWAATACIQPMYNLLKRQAEVELLPMAMSEGLGCFPYSPLAGGMLTGKYIDDQATDRGRLDSNKMYQVRYGAPSYAEATRAFVELARAWGIHPVSLAVAWVGSRPGVTAPIIGARSVEQLEPALASAQLELDPTMLAQLTELTPTPPPATDRNEESSSHNYGSR